MESHLSLTSARCVIIIDESLPMGQIANAAAVIGLTVGQRHPALVGDPLIDATGTSHPGLIPIGITILSAPQDELCRMRSLGVETACDIVDFPIEGQQTKDYQAFKEAVAAIETTHLQYAGIALIGEKKNIRKITNHLQLLK